MGRHEVVIGGMIHDYAVDICGQNPCNLNSRGIPDGMFGDISENAGSSQNAGGIDRYFLRNIGGLDDLTRLLNRMSTDDMNTLLNYIEREHLDFGHEL